MSRRIAATHSRRIVSTHTDKDGTILQELEDGTQIQINPNGVRIEVKPTGEIIQTRPDQVVIELHTNGNRLQTFPDGCMIFTNKDGTTKQINPDGTCFEMRADGTIVRNMSHKQVTIPQEALIRQEPYNSADSKTPDSTTTPRKRLKEAQEIDRLVNNATPTVQSPEIIVKKKKAQDTVDVDDLEKLVDDHLQTGKGKKKKKGGKKKSAGALGKKIQKSQSKDLRDKKEATVTVHPKGSKNADVAGKTAKTSTKGSGASSSSTNSKPNAKRLRTKKRRKKKNTATDSIRVFVSSTFRDFGLERDYMMSKTLPILREHCFKKGLTITFVDLRWGVTSEESGRGDVIKLCLEEVEACAPFFICMLGNRYGWHLIGSGDETLLETTFDVGAKHFPWVQDYRHRSVTEIEILGGALLEPNHTGAVVFYFREHEKFLKRYTGTVIKDADVCNYQAESPHAQKSQTALKEEIVQANYKPRYYSHLQELSDIIVADMKAAITSVFPSSDVDITVAGRWRLQHKVFASCLSVGYVPPKGIMRQMDEQVKHNPIVVVKGGSGVGKSALLANWAIRHQERNRKAIILTHFTGSTVQSTDHFHLVWRIMTELKEMLKMDFDLRGLVDNKMVEIFPTFLSSAVTIAESKKKSILLVLDAVGKLADRENALELNWVQDVPGLKWVLSTVPGKTLEAAKRHKWPEVEVKELDIDERKEIIRTYLAEYGKKFDNTQIKKVSSKDQTRNPLYLRTLLDEARFFGNFFELNNYLDKLLQSEDTTSLYGKVLERVAADCSEELVNQAMTFVLAARDGIAEKELLWTMNQKRLGKFSTLLLAMREQLCTRSALMTFFHEDARDAVEKRITDEEVLVAHRRLCDYFESEQEGGTEAEWMRRCARELPLHLKITKQWKRLETFLCRAEVMAFMLDDDGLKYETCQYWRELQKSATINPQESLLKALADTKEKFANKVEKDEEDEVNTFVMTGHVATTLQLLGNYSEAARLQERALAFYEVHYGPTNKRTANACNNLGVLYQHTGEFEKALRVGRRSLDISKKTVGAESSVVATALNNLGALYSDLGQKDKARESYEQSLAIDEKKYGKKHTKVALTCNNLGALYDAEEDNEKAMYYYKRSLKIQEEKLGPDHATVAFICNNMGLLHGRMGNFAEAQQFYDRALRIHTQRFGHDHPNVASVCTNLGVLYQMMEKWDRSLKFLKRGMEIDEQHLAADNPKVAAHLSNLGSYYSAKGELNKALEYYHRAEDVLQKKFTEDHMEVAAVYNNIGSAYMKINNLSKAEDYLTKALNICRRKNKTQVSLLNNLAYLYTEMENFALALNYYKEALRTTEDEMGEDCMQVASLCNNLGALYVDMKDYDTGIQYYKRTRTIMEKKKGLNNPEYAAVLYNIGILLYNRRKFAEAKPYIESVVKVQEKLLGPHHRDTEATKNLLKSWPK